MAAPTLVQRLDRVQMRRRPLALLLATVKKFGDDQAAKLAVVVAFYAFFSIFPLLLVFVTLLGYVLAGDHALMHTLSTSVLSRFPVIGTTLRAQRLHGSASALVIGIVLALWSGSAVTGAMSDALAQIWEIPRPQRPGFLRKRLRGLAVLLGLALLFFLASAASGLAGGGLGSAGVVIVGVVVSLILNLCLFTASFHFLCAQPEDWHALLPGASAAAVLWTLLQSLGGAYIAHIGHSDSAYGTFAVVLGILTWLHLGTQMTLYCAEFNTVLAGRRWPRSLFDRPGDQPAGARPLGGRRAGEVSESSAQADESTALPEPGSAHRSGDPGCG